MKLYSDERLSLMREVGEISLRDFTSGVFGAPHILFQFQLIAEKSKGMDRILNDCLRWLIRNRITGHRFVDWVKNENANSALLAFAELRKKVEHDLEVKPVFSDHRGPL